MKKKFLLLYMLATVSLFAGGQVQLITNGNFSALSSGWTTSGNWFISSSFSCYHSSTAYAYAGDASGNPVINEFGNLKQTVTIPANATSATLSFYTSQNTQETTLTTSFDYLEVYIYNSTGTTNLATLVHISNLNAASYPGCQTYGFYSYNLSAYIGQTIQVWFHVFSDGGPKNTMFRVDDVSLLANIPSCTYSISPVSVSPGSAAGSGSVSVTAGSGCGWTAVSNNSSWLTVNSGSSGSGNGTVNYSYTSNTGTSPRTGTITIAGQTFTVTQSGTVAGLLHGVDVSHYNGTINWSQVSSSNKSFAFVKATEGMNTNDAVFPVSMTSSNPGGVVLGAYHIARPDFSSNNTAAGEASHFLNVAGQYIGQGFLPPVLDLEANVAISYTATHTTLELATWLQNWLNAVKVQTGVWPLLYADRSRATLLYPYYQNGTINANVKLWIADYGTTANPRPAGQPLITGWENWPWLFHQYFAPSIAGNNPAEYADPGMDQDVFYGTITDFNILIHPSTSSPDLKITAGTQSVSSSSVTAGSNIIAYASEDNSGSGPAATNVVGLWLSQSSVLNTDNAVYLGAISGYPSLPAGSNSIILNSSVNIPASTPSGTYYLFFWADGGGCGISSNCSNCSGVVSESNECNNFASVILTVNNNSTCTDQHESNNTAASASLVFAQPVTNSSNLTWQGNIGFTGDDDWYRINTGVCGTITVNLSNLPADYDIELWDKYSDTPPFGQVLSGSYNTSTTNESVSFSYQGSNTAYIKVYAKDHTTYSTSTCYNIQFIFTPCSGGPPANDICTNATLLPVNSTCIPLTNQYLTNANPEEVPIYCNDGSAPVGYDVWYKFVAIGPDQTIYFDNNGSFDAYLSLNTACPDNNNTSFQIACDNNQGPITIPATGLTVGNTYYIRIHDFNGYAQNMPFSICVYGNSCAIPDAVTVSGGGIYCGSTLLTAGGGSGGTIYWQGTTSNGTSLTTPVGVQSVSTSGTYYFRAHNSCGWGAQGSATVTINNLPGSVTVNGGGTYCSNTLLNASGGSGGTIYWQGNVSNGTSLATPSSSQVVSASGTYYFRSYNNCGWGTQGSAVVVITNTANTWTGAISSAWENPGNWSCGSVPDATTDVIINSGNVIINSNAICRSLSMGQGVIVTTNSNYSLTIVH